MNIDMLDTTSTEVNFSVLLDSFYQTQYWNGRA